MKFELFIALRYLFALRRQAYITAFSVASLLGVALGVAALIIVMGVMTGFTTDLRDKLIGAQAHIVMYKARYGSGPSNAELLARARSTPGVVGATPFLYSEMLASSPVNVKGVVLRGIDPLSGPDVLNIFHSLSVGDINYMDMPENAPALPATPEGERVKKLRALGEELRDGLPGIVVGEKLAARLDLALGSRMNLMALSGQRSSAGYTPKIRPFVVTGMFSTGMYEFDSSLVFISLSAARDLLGLPADSPEHVEVAVADVFNVEPTAQALRAKLGPAGYVVETWQEMNESLFAALKLEKLAMGIALALIILVGSFSIITSLIMLVMKKTKDIAIFMAMGATPRMVGRIFLIQGTLIGALGTAIGFILGLTGAFLLKKYQFIELPKGAYPMDHVPVLIDGGDLVLIAIASVALCFLATIYPARQAAKLEPADALRYE